MFFRAFFMGPAAGAPRFAGPVGLDGTFRADVDRPGPLLAARATWTDGVVSSYT